ncbi:MAG TPA: hypothetical protein GXX51_02120 [Firmicutes bacterium]|nr:hypothetical protein [Bacillota bacterium]
MRYERIPTDNPIRQIWNRMGILSSLSGAMKFLETAVAEKEISLDPSIVKEKARGLAFCLRSAREYFSVSVEGNLTSACLAYYYGTFSLLKALLLADVSNDVTLSQIEKYTRYGHGLGTMSEDRSKFPESELLMILANGFLPCFLKACGYDIANMAVNRRYNNIGEVDDVDKPKLIPLADLLSRIPEIKPIYVELFKRQPDYLSYRIQKIPGNNLVHITAPFYRNSPYLNADSIRKVLGLPPSVQFIEIDEYGERGLRTTSGVAEYFVDGRRIYESVMAYDCYVSPLLGIGDVLLFDFMFLYTLSIWVRYRPALWRELMEGDYDAFRPLIVDFLTVAERIIPNIVLNRLYDRKFLFAGFSYYS